jgi:hypothetical protein
MVLWGRFPNIAVFSINTLPERVLSIRNWPPPGERFLVASLLEMTECASSAGGFLLTGFFVFVIPRATNW